MSESIRVLCVDDNEFLVQAMQVKLSLERDIEPVGHLSAADDLVGEVERSRPDIVLLDIDMPGRDPLSALTELTRAAPDTRTIILSGYVRDDYLDRAVEAGAWGYLSKSSNPDEVVAAIRQVARGEFAFGPEVLKHYKSWVEASEG